jgi:hypothetical protein
MAGCPHTTPKVDTTWGCDFQDMNLALGNLVNDVHTAEAAVRS